MKVEWMVIRVLMENKKERRRKGGFVFGVGVKGEGKRIMVRVFL